MSEQISVKDRLPEVETEVLIRAQWKCCGDPHSIITTAYYEDGTVLEDNSRYNRNEIWEWGIYDEEKDDIESQKDGGTVTIISMKIIIIMSMMK